MAGPVASGGPPSPTQAHPRVDAPAPVPPATPTTPPPDEWRANWARKLPLLAQISGHLRRRPDVGIMRSSQLDAARLDEELSGMLRDQFLRAFALARPAAVARLQPELTLLLDFLIFRFSIWEGRPLPGMALMNLRYRNEAAVALPPASQLGGGGDGSGSGGSVCVAGGHSGVEGPGLSRLQRSLYCLGAVVLRYAWARAGHHAAAAHWGDARAAGWRRRAWVAMRRAETAYRLASLANFLAFLRSGRYRSLLDRLLRARLVYRQHSAARAISFEYLNRQLVWSELSELLLFLLPLVNAQAIKRALRRYLPRLPALGGGAAAATRAAAGGARAPGVEQPCGVCSAADVLDPWQAQPCGHRFCYYCLRSRCLADAQYCCPLCLARVDAMRRETPGGAGGSGSKQGGGSEQSHGSGGGRRGSGGGGERRLDRNELSLAGWLRA